MRVIYFAILKVLNTYKAIRNHMNFHIFRRSLCEHITIEIYLCPVLLDVCEDRMDPTTSRPGLQIYDYATWQFRFLPTFKFVSFVDVFWQL